MEIENTFGKPSTWQRYISAHKGLKMHVSELAKQYNKLRDYEIEHAINQAKRRPRPTVLTDTPPDAWYRFVSLGSEGINKRMNKLWCGHENLHFPCVDDLPCKAETCCCGDFKRGAYEYMTLCSDLFNRIRHNYGYYGLLAFITSPWNAYVAYRSKEITLSETAEEWKTEKYEWYWTGELPEKFKPHDGSKPVPAVEETKVGTEASVPSRGRSRSRSRSIVRSRSPSPPKSRRGSIDIQEVVETAVMAKDAASMLSQLAGYVLR